MTWRLWLLDAGKLGRAAYLGSGVALVLLKYNLDRWLLREDTDWTL